MKIYKITEASEYLGVSINTLKTLANNGKIKSFKTTGDLQLMFSTKGTPTWSIGCDVSATGAFSISNGNALGTTEALAIAFDRSSAVFKTGDLFNQFSVDSGYCQLSVQNTHGGATSSTRITISNIDAAGDCYMLFDPHFGVGGDRRFQIGQTQADVFQITSTTDTSTSNMNGTAILKATITGAITKPAQPLFIAYLAATVANATGDGTFYTVICDTINKQQGSSYNNATGEFTVPVTGSYSFFSRVKFGNISAPVTTSDIFFYVNGAIGAYATGPDCNLAAIRDGSNNAALVQSTLMSLTAGDVVKLVAWGTGGAKTVNVVGLDTGVQSTYFAGYLVG